MPAKKAPRQQRTGALLNKEDLRFQKVGCCTAAIPCLADDYTVTPSGLRYFDVRTGNGRTPEQGDFVLLDWSGFTEGYQGKRIGNSTKTDEPFRFQLGAGEAIPAIEEAVRGMKQGGVRRVEILGSRPELGYSLNKAERFSGQRLTGDYFKYRKGPQPINLSGQRALDFVLDNPTLQDFNRTLLFDIKLVTVSH
ncbi:hypothetical protein WJX74_010660 [Apatococcus lobatus]|uniref:peptidylprolyl isomerase n=1 Tax=Apatococcus lobatus TaxID=904363 RepID=A0AAW1S7T4_9CHLO